MADKQIGKLFVDIRGKLDGLEKDLAKAKGRLEQWGSKVGGVGSKLTMGVTAPLLALGTAAVNAAFVFNKAMADIATLIPGNVVRVDELKTAIQNMAMETGASTDDLAVAMYRVISAFGDGADSVKILGINAQAAKAGLATASEAIMLTSAVTKAYGDTSEAAVKKAADLALLTVRLGQTTFPELANSMGRVTALSQTLKVSQEELYSVFATATGVTGKASEVSTQFVQVLNSFMKPTKDMLGLFKEWGVDSGAAAIETLGLGEAIKRVVAAGGEGGKNLSKYVQSVEASTLALTLGGTQAVAFAEKLAQMEKGAGTLEEAFRAATTGVNAAGTSYDKLKQVGTVAMQRLGDATLEALDPKTLTSFTESVTKMIKAFAALTPETKAFIIKALALTVALGPVLTAANALITSLNFLKTPLKWLGTVGIPWLVRGFAALAGMGAGTVAALAAIGLAAHLLAQPFKDALDRFILATSGMDQAAGALATRIGVFFTRMGASIAASVRATYSACYTWLVSKWEGIVAGVRKAVDRVKSLFSNLYRAVVGGSIIPDMVNEVAAWMKKLGSTAMVDPVKNATKESAEHFQTFADSVKSTVANLGQQMKTLGSKLALGFDLDPLAEEVSYLEQAITSLLNSGLKATDPVIVKLTARFLELTAAIKKAADDATALTARFASNAAKETAYEDALTQAAADRAQAFLDAGRSMEEKAFAVARAYEVLKESVTGVGDATWKLIQEQMEGGNKPSPAEQELGRARGLRDKGGFTPEDLTLLNQYIASLEELVQVERERAAIILEGAAAEKAKTEAEKAALLVREQAQQADALLLEGLEKLGRGGEVAEEMLKRFIQQLRTAAETALPMMGEALRQVADELEKNGVKVAESVPKQVSSLAEMVAAMLTGMKVSASDAIGIVLQNLDKLGVKSDSVFGRLLGAVGAYMQAGGGVFGVIAGVGKLFGLAKGGTITSPGLAMVGERGPEVLNLPRGASVTPLDRVGAGAGTQQTIIVQLDGRVLAKATAQNFPAVLRLHGAAQ